MAQENYGNKQGTNTSKPSVTPSRKDQQDSTRRDQGMERDRNLGGAQPSRKSTDMDDAGIGADEI